MKIPVAGTYLNAWMIRPPDFDSTRAYPLLQYVYGGPGSQEVVNAWTRTRDLFFYFLAEQGYIVACADNRGTPGRGRAFTDFIYLHLGKTETQDQATAAHYFSTLPYIDRNRIGIYGWSYGATIALLSVMQDSVPFKTAIAVAPVTDWKLYDNIYAERYMRTPKENLSGYRYNPLRLASKLKGRLLLMHGMADDNVHFQHTVFLIDALNQAHKDYRLFIYPDKEHSITGAQSRFDIFSRMYRFIKETL
jgi:dipeptidyl-peptidase-4